MQFRINIIMNTTEVIHLALEKAHQEGYRMKEALTEDYVEINVTEYDEKSGLITVHVKGKSGKDTLQLNIRQLLFDVVFARALFGDYWETHLNLMACSANQVEYLQTYLLQPHE